MRFELNSRLLPRWLPRTLLMQLTLWNTAVVMVLLGLTMLAMLAGHRVAQFRDNDAVLLEDTEEVRLMLEPVKGNAAGIQAAIDLKARVHPRRKVFVVLYDRQGRERFHSFRMPKTGLPSAHWSAQPKFSQAGINRIVDVPLDVPDAPPMILRVANSLEFIDEEERRLSQIMLLTGGVLLAIGPLGGFLLARRATQPLSQLIRMAGSMRPGQLDERLPLRGSGDELDQMSATINGLLDRIAQYVASQREFIANAAHELRSPLAAVQSSIDVALAADRTSNQYKELLETLVEECASLATLVNQLLLLAEAEADTRPLARRSVRLDQVIARAVEMFQGVAEERGVSLRFSARGAVTIGADPASLRQVVNNLVDNALKFTAAGGSVIVEIEAHPPAGWQSFTVSDTGIGIPPEDVPFVFARFFRGDRSRHREGQAAGTGLGLSICQAIVSRHGGRMEVESQLGRGSLFRVWLPIADSAIDLSRESASLIGATR